MPSAKIERLRCPEHFQKRLTQVGGINRYGQPNFKLAWAQTETMRQGGQWEGDGDQFVGYRDCLLGDGNPHWMLLQWVDAGKSHEMPHLRAQSDVSFYLENCDVKTGLQILGEYPYHGSYKIALPLMAKTFEAGQMRITAFPLSTEIIEMMVPIIKASMMLTVATKEKFLKECEEKEDLDYAKQVDAAYNSVKLSAAGRAASWLDDKVRSMEKHFNAALITKMQRDRVFQRKHAL
jgi:hypothetical protein